LISISAAPAGIALGTVNVAWSRAFTSATRARWVRPPALIVTVSNSISAAFSVIVRAGAFSATSIRSLPPKVAFSRSGVIDRS